MSYPLCKWENPIPGRRYATRGRDVPQEKVAQRRERELHYRQMWTGTVDYYGKVQNKADIHQRWFSDASNSRHRKKVDDWDDDSKLDERREKLRKKLGAEQEIYQLELSRCRSASHAGPPSTLNVSAVGVSPRCGSQPLPKPSFSPHQLTAASCEERLAAVSRQLEQRQAARQLQQRQQAEQLLKKQWASNNSVMREIESERLSAEARQMWTKQMKERESERERAREAETREKEERKRQSAEEEERRERERADAEKRVQHIKDTLQSQVEENRQLQQRLEALCEEERSLLERRQHVEKAIAQREHEQRSQRHRQLRLDQIRQCNDRLRLRSLDVEKTITEEISFIDRLLQSGERDHAIMADSQQRAETLHARNILNTQLQLETTRRRQSEVLFSEEADSVWRRREAEWAREEEARRRLAASVVASWREQIDQRLDERQKQLQQLREQQETAGQQLHETEQQLARHKQQQQLKLAWQQQIDEKRAQKSEQLDCDESYIMQQQARDAQELANIRRELAKLQFSSRAFRQYERVSRSPRRSVW